MYDLMYNLIGVQPMTAPSGLIYTFRPRYGQLHKGPGWERQTFLPEELYNRIVLRGERVEYYIDHYYYEAVYNLIHYNTDSHILIQKPEEVSTFRIEWSDIDWNGFHFVT